MKKLAILLPALLAFSSCDKKVETKDFLSDLTLSNYSAVADGQTTINVSVKLSEKSSSDRRNIVFSTNAGVFTNSGTARYTAKAEFDNGYLIAKATLRMPVKPGYVKVTVQPEYDSPVKEYTLSDSLYAAPSAPVTLKTEPSSYGISGNFLNEVRITGTFKNSDNKFVSQGYKVVFEDFLSDGSPANGKYLKVVNPTGDSSLVRVFYSVPSYSIGTTIKLRTTLLDASNLKTGIKDSIILTVNN